MGLRDLDTLVALIHKHQTMALDAWRGRSRAENHARAEGASDALDALLTEAEALP